MPKKKIIVIISIFVLITLGLGIVITFFLPKPKKDSTANPGPQISSELNNLTNNVPNISSILNGIPTSSSQATDTTTKIELAKFNPEVIAATQSQNNQILEVPLLYLNDPYYEPLVAQIPQLKSIKADNPTITNLSIFYDTTSKKYSIPKVLSADLHSFIYNNQEYWLYIKGTTLYFSKADFSDEVLVPYSPAGDEEEIEEIPVTLKIQQAGNESPIFWIKNNIQGSNSSIETSSITQINLENYFKKQNIVTDNINLTNFEYKAKDQDKDKTASPSSSIKQNTSTRADEEEFAPEFEYSYYPLANGSVFFHSRYYSNNFWILQKESDQFQLIDKIDLETDNSIISKCIFDQNLCFSYNIEANELYKYDLKDKTPKIEKVKTSLQTTISTNEYGRSAEVLGYQFDRLLQYDQNKKELGLWYLGKWLVLLKI